LWTAFAIVPMLALPGCQAPPPTNASGVPRTPAGRPDLQGVWSYATRTPLQRPKGVKGKTFTEAEAAAYLWLDVRLADVPLPSQRDSRDPEERRGPPGHDGHLTAGDVAFGQDRGAGLITDNRSSAIGG